MEAGQEQVRRPEPGSEVIKGIPAIEMSEQGVRDAAATPPPTHVTTNSGHPSIDIRGADDSLVIMLGDEKVYDQHGDGYYTIELGPHRTAELTFKLWNVTGGPAYVDIAITPTTPPYRATVNSWTLPNLVGPVSEWFVTVASRG
jgi:hypothetical protein